MRGFHFHIQIYKKEGVGVGVSPAFCACSCRMSKGHHDIFSPFNWLIMVVVYWQISASVSLTTGVEIEEDEFVFESFAIFVFVVAGV